nr:MAG TPA: hypothetical protein [Caudoviricetes sp.]
MRGIELKHIGVRSFMLKGLTARWGIDGDRPPMPPALRTALVAWYNTEIQKATNFDVIESYAEDFTTWSFNPTRGVQTHTNKSVHITETLIADRQIAELPNARTGTMTFKVSGLDGTRNVRVTRGIATAFRITQDGVYTMDTVERYSGFCVSVVGACDITIEQLPASKLTDLSGNGHHLHLYGFTGSDNIVDNMLQHTGTQFGVSYGQPILTDYTVCSTREWSSGAGAFAVKGDGNQRAFIFERFDGALERVSSFEAYNTVAIDKSKQFVYMSKTSYNGTPITAGTTPDKDMLTVGGIYNANTGVNIKPFHGAYKSFVLFNRTLTTEELAYVERWMA